MTAYSRRSLLAGGLVSILTGAAEFASSDTSALPAITADDLAAADRLAARNFTAAERAKMVSSAERMRSNMRAMREVDLDASTAPAARFDPRLPDTPIPKGRSTLKLNDEKRIAYDGRPESLAFATVAELGRLIRSRRITSTELTKMYLDRVKRYGPQLYCVVTVTEELALTQAEQADREIVSGKYRGPLHGIPFGVKDLLATRGIRTTFGAKPFEDQVLNYDATVVERLANAGAVLLAKLSMGELAMGDVWFGGRTRTPWNPRNGSGGSSAGPGAATAAGLVAFAIGTETLGSIVNPSTVNGITGLRPTFGRVSRHGAMALSWTMDKIGPMCRSAEDCAIVLHAIHGPDGRDLTVANIPFSWNARANLSKLRVGIDTPAFEAMQKNAKRAPIYSEALGVLKGMGIAPMPIKLPATRPAYQALAWTTISVESSAAFQRLTASGKLDLLARQSEDAWPNIFRVGSTVPAADYLQALRVRAQLQREMADALKDVDLYITVPFSGPSIAYTNLAGHPTIVTRCGMLDDAPQMIEFTGQLYREDGILTVANAFERATAWHKQWPDLEKMLTTVG